MIMLCVMLHNRDGAHDITDLKTQNPFDNSDGPLVYSPRGMKGLEGSLGLETPIALTTKIRTSYGTPSIIFFGSKVVSLQRSKFSLIHRELCFFFRSMKYPVYYVNKSMN